MMIYGRFLHFFVEFRGTIRHNTDISFAQATPRTFFQKYNI